MPARTEVLGNGAIGREKSLSMAGRLKSLHALFSLARGLMGVLRTIIEIPVLAMFYFRQTLSLSRSLALQCVGDDHSRHIQ